MSTFQIPVSTSIRVVIPLLATRHETFLTPSLLCRSARMEKLARDSTGNRHSPSVCVCVYKRNTRHKKKRKKDRRIKELRLEILKSDLMSATEAKGPHFAF